jgi:hypothetical protein
LNPTEAIESRLPQLEDSKHRITVYLKEGIYPFRELTRGERADAEARNGWRSQRITIKFIPGSLEGRTMDFRGLAR